MADHSKDIARLLRRAIQAQVDIGLGEVILDRHRMADRVFESQPEDTMPAPDRQDRQPQMFAEPKAIDEQPSYDSLDAHRKAICDCQKCPLGATRNKFVFGVGCDTADIMFVGEAPGAEEDRQGEPFVGRAGQLLDKILAAMNLSREDVYIANILKCRPPNNRDPLPNEVEECIGYLHEQIRLIKPRIICALGRIAAQNLLQTSTPLGKLRKRWHEFQGVPMMVTYHPAALLRFQAYKRDTWEDMQMLMARYEEMKAPSG